MKPLIVVTHTESEVLLLRAILQIPCDTERLRFETAGGWSNAESYARTLLMMDEADVALVINADSYEPDRAEGRRRFVKQSLGDVTLHRKYHTVVVRPKIVGLLFEEPSLVEQMAGKPLSEVDSAVAYYEPDKVLRRLLGVDDFAETFRAKLPELDLSPLANLPEMRGLKKFLQPAERKLAVSR